MYISMNWISDFVDLSGIDKIELINKFSLVHRRSGRTKFSTKAATSAVSSLRKSSRWRTTQSQRSCIC